MTGAIVVPLLPWIKCRHSSLLPLPVLPALNRFKVTALCAYIVVGTILWASVLKSGVHTTLERYHRILYSIEGKNGETPLHDFGAYSCTLVILYYSAIIRFCQCEVLDGIDLSMSGITIIARDFSCQLA